MSISEKAFLVTVSLWVGIPGLIILLIINPFIIFQILCVIIIWAAVLAIVTIFYGFAEKTYDYFYNKIADEWHDENGFGE